MTETINPLRGPRALRVAIAAGVCLVIVEWLQLPHGNLAVWTTFMVMVQFTHTSFQKGTERIIGRGFGILAGLVLLTLFRNAPLLAALMKFVALAIFFYIYFSGRLAYTFLNAGQYLAAIVEVGRVNLEMAFETGAELFVAIVIGVAIANLTNWLAEAESDLHIDSGGAPLFPLRADWISHSLRLTVTVVLAQILTRRLELPTTAAIISVLVLVITPEVHSLLRKGTLRLEGALLAGVWATGSLLLLGRMPHFPLLLALLCLGILIAGWIANGPPATAYAGVQMGLVLPMLLVMSPYEYGSLHALTGRLEGIVVALGSAIVVGTIWSTFDDWLLTAVPQKGV